MWLGSDKERTSVLFLWFAVGLSWLGIGRLIQISYESTVYPIEAIACRSSTWLSPLLTGLRVVVLVSHLLCIEWSTNSLIRRCISFDRVRIWWLYSSIDVDLGKSVRQVQILIRSLSVVHIQFWLISSLRMLVFIVLIHAEQRCGDFDIFILDAFRLSNSSIVLFLRLLSWRLLFLCQRVRGIHLTWHAILQIQDHFLDESALRSNVVNVRFLLWRVYLFHWRWHFWFLFDGRNLVIGISPLLILCVLYRVEDVALAYGWRFESNHKVISWWLFRMTHAFISHMVFLSY